MIVIQNTAALVTAFVFVWFVGWQLGFQMAAVKNAARAAE